MKPAQAQTSAWYLLRQAVYTLLPAVAALLGCITEPGIPPDTDAGRGTIVVWEKNGLNAAVYLDYRTTGRTTPDTIRNIPEGTHTVHLFYKDYAQVAGTNTILVREKRISEAAFEMQKSSCGMVAVTSDPPGAIVALNHIDFGVSPLALDGLPIGTYTVNARMGNLRSRDTTVQLSTATMSRVALNLKPATSVVVEYFSNIDCPGCPEAASALDDLIVSLPQYRGQLCKIAIHAYWPAGGDPLYVAAKEDCNARIDFYNMATDRDGLPAVYINGTKLAWSPNKKAAFIAAAKKTITSIITERPPIVELTLGAVRVDTITPALLRVTGSLLVKGAISSHRAYVALVEEFIGYPSPIGTNGQKSFDAIFRGFADGADGVVVPEHGAVSFSTDIVCPEKLPCEFTLVAFLQDRTTREIVQSQRVSLY